MSRPLFGHNEWAAGRFDTSTSKARGRKSDPLYLMGWRWKRVQNLRAAKPTPVTPPPVEEDPLAALSPAEIAELVEKAVTKALRTRQPIMSQGLKDRTGWSEVAPQHAAEVALTHSLVASANTQAIINALAKQRGIDSAQLAADIAAELAKGVEIDVDVTVGAGQ